MSFANQCLAKSFLSQNAMEENLDEVADGKLENVSVTIYVQ